MKSQFVCLFAHWSLLSFIHHSLVNERVQIDCLFVFVWSYACCHSFIANTYISVSMLLTFKVYYKRCWFNLQLQSDFLDVFAWSDKCVHLFIANPHFTVFMLADFKVQYEVYESFVKWEVVVWLLIFVCVVIQRHSFIDWKSLHHSLYAIKFQDLAYEMQNLLFSQKIQHFDCLFAWVMM